MMDDAPPIAIGSPPTAADRQPPAASHDLAALVHRYSGPLLHYVHNLVGSHETAQDIVQDVFLRYHRQHRNNGRTDIASPAGWLYRVAHNASMDARRRRKCRTDHAPALADHAAAVASQREQSDDPAAQLSKAEAAALAMSELAHLPDPLPRIVQLKIIHGLTLREISQTLNIPLATVHHQLNRALTDLAAKLKNRGAI